VTILRTLRLTVITGAMALAACSLSACGGGSPASVAHIATTVPPSTTAPPVPTAPARSSSSSTSPGPSRSAGPGPGDVTTQLLEFAQCMRSNGVPDFPDPSGGGFELPVGIAPTSPAFEAARTKCEKYLPPGPGSGPPPSAQALARMLKIAQCMRRQGISDFPDPQTSVPPHAIGGPAGGVISDIDGVILVFPSAIDMQSPAFSQAAATCGFPLHNH